jgi:acetoin utilization protein AcuC
MKTAFVYSDDFARFSYGSSHPLKPFRLKLTYELIKACGLLSPDDPRVFVPAPAKREDLLAFHSPEYIDMLEDSNSGKAVPGASAFGLGEGDNPVFPGMFDWSLLIAGASLTAADLVDSGEAAIAFNIGGGLHHALASRASGFCYINDPALAIKFLLGRGRRVAYIDIDAHHGDGVQAAFYGTDRVLTVSLHETGRMLFPGTGFEQETGEGAGGGCSVNVPLPPETDDELFVHAFRSVVPPLVERFKPDVIVSQLGVDTFRNDPLAHLNVTTNGFCPMIEMIKSLAPKWVALGGGGYDSTNAARAWTLAWAIMNDREAPGEIPGSFLRTYGEARFPGKLRDEPFSVDGVRKEAMRTDVDRVIAALQRTVRPES